MLFLVDGRNFLSLLDTVCNYMLPKLSFGLVEEIYL